MIALIVAAPKIGTFDQGGPYASKNIFAIRILVVLLAALRQDSFSSRQLIVFTRTFTESSMLGAFDTMHLLFYVTAVTAVAERYRVGRVHKVVLKPNFPDQACALLPSTCDRDCAGRPPGNVFDTFSPYLELSVGLSKPPYF
jgi:hypothetical protein